VFFTCRREQNALQNVSENKERSTLTRDANKNIHSKQFTENTGIKPQMDGQTRLHTLFYTTLLKIITNFLQICITSS
jgi:hypothetical protein